MHRGGWIFSSSRAIFRLPCVRDSRSHAADHSEDLKGPKGGNRVKALCRRPRTQYSLGRAHSRNPVFHDFQSEVSTGDPTQLPVRVPELSPQTIQLTVGRGQVGLPWLSSKKVITNKIITTYFRKTCYTGPQSHSQNSWGLTGFQNLVFVKF